MVYVSISSGVQRFGDLRTLEILISERHNALLVKLASRMNYGFIVSFSVAFFLNQISSFLDRNRIKYTPNSVGDNVYLNWKWRNFLISFIHALITGIGSLICLYYEPTLINDVISVYIEAGYLLTCISHGYFIYDLIEMISNLSYKGSKELIAHHIMILVCFTITVVERKYVGYCCVALIIEISNIFLHFRQLLLIANMSKNKVLYRVNSVINIAMFFIARGSSMFWLWYSLYVYRQIVPNTPLIITFVSLTGISIMTSVLLFRIFNSDFIRHMSGEKERYSENSKSNHKNTHSNTQNEAILNDQTHEQVICTSSTKSSSNGFSLLTTERTGKTDETSLRLRAKE